MKWIGQHIYDLIARFRNTVYISENLTIGSDADIEPKINILNDENSVEIGIANATNDMVTGSADGDLVINSVGDHKIILAQNDAEVITIEDTAKVTIADDLIVNGDSISIASSSSTGGKLALYEGTDNGTNILRINAPAAITTNTDLVLPDGVGSNGQFLTTDGNNPAALSWTTASSGISFDGSTADGILTYKDSDEATVEANLTFSSEALSIGANDTGTATIKRTQRTSAGDGGNLNISGGVVKSGETNEAGGDLTLEGGKGTGSGAGGHVKIQTYAAGSSGTSLNTSATIWQFHDTGLFEAPGNISSSGTILSGWHGSTTRVKILASDFIPDDGGRPVFIDDTGSGSENFFLESYSSNPLYATVTIPTGFTATHVMIYGSATDAVEVWEMQINSKTGVSKGTGNVDTEIDITDVASSTTNYLLIQVANASGNEVHGGYITIAAS